MKGTVSAINQLRGMVAVSTERDFSIFEIISSNRVDVGHTVSWQEDTSLGRTEITNHTTGERFDVFFQNHWVGKTNLRQQLRMD